MAKIKETENKESKETYNHETFGRIAQNTLVFLDKLKLSAVGEENKREIQAYIQSVSMIEHIVEGNLYVVDPKMVKEEYLEEKSED